MVATAPLRSLEYPVKMSLKLGSVATTLDLASGQRPAICLRLIFDA
jgi:hypothetical protein